jgi:RecJ-like exonuclease
MDLEAGDTVFVQVQNVRDNGNVDLGWSIRQDDSQFRGTLIDDPDADTELLAEGDESDSEDDETGPVKRTVAGSDGSSGSDSPSRSEQSSREDRDGDGDEEQTVSREPEEVTIDALEEHVGKRVRIEGEVVTVRQTSGPTVFELQDETGSIECAAFEEAGVRAYPEVDERDVVRIEGEVERRRGESQVETEALVVLEDEEREAVTERMHDAMVQRARPDEVDLLADDAALDGLSEAFRDAAMAIRRAVIEGRPIVVRHAATADGYVASAAIERATLPLIREEQQGVDAEYHFFDRRPLEGSVYDMDDATNDVTTMLSNRDRHDEKLPLFVFVAAGGTAESLAGFDLLDVYGVGRVVVDDGDIDPEVRETVDVLVSPESGKTTATVPGSNVALHVNTDVREDLAHLPAVSFWEDTPEQYTDLAAEAGYDEDDVRSLREAVGLEAFYQSYEDKRELIIDLLFADEADDPVGLAAHISEQYRTRMDTEIETAESNLERRELDGETVLVLDTDAYTHEYEFPPLALLLDELYRRNREEGVALVGIDEDEAYVRSDRDLGVREIVESAREAAPKAALDARSAREGRVEFLSGERDAAREALLEALGGALSSAATA